MGSLPVHAHRGQAGQGLPGAIDVVHAPAAIPTSVGAPGCGGDRRPPDRPPGRPAGGPAGPALPAPGRPGRACWDRSSHCDRRRGHSRETGDCCCDRTPPSRRRRSAWPTSSAAPRSMAAAIRPVIRCRRPRFSGTEILRCGRSRGPTSVTGPVLRDCSVLGACPRSNRGGQRHQHHRRVVAVGIELVVVFEIPAARLGVDVPGPIAGPGHFLVQQPRHRPRQRRTIGRHAAGRQRPHRDGRVPNRRLAGLQPRGRPRRIFDHQVVELLAGSSASPGCRRRSPGTSARRC